MNIKPKLDSFLKTMESKFVEVKSGKISTSEKANFLNSMKQLFLERAKQIVAEIEERAKGEHENWLAPEEVKAAIRQSRAAFSQHSKTLDQQIALFESAGVEVTTFRRNLILTYIEKGNFDGIQNLLCDLLLMEKGKVKVSDKAPFLNLDSAIGGSGSGDDEKMTGQW